MRKPNEILLLSDRDLRELMPFDDCVAAVAEAFRLLAEGHVISPLPMELHGGGGTFHVKAAGVPGGRSYVAVKVNANFPQNPARGLPTIQGAILLFESETGAPLALLDSIEITLQRTGAATALAARYLARPDSQTATICGCGAQAPYQLIALQYGLKLRRIFAWDRDALRAKAFAAQMGDACEIIPITDLRQAALASDVIITCTTASDPFLGLGDVRPGTFIAAVGADNPAKSEITPELMAKAVVVADVTSQASVMGDLHHAMKAGLMTRENVRGELADLITGRTRGREHAEEITVFDSTGTGVQDVAAAVLAYERALGKTIGLAFALRAPDVPRAQGAPAGVLRTFLPFI
jgi:alanine dehydrogenase